MIDYKTYIKGFLMGTCDLIPGISGGTIAFITGIYAKLIGSVKSFSPILVTDSIKYLLKHNEKTKNSLKEGIKNLNLAFLITLFAGIGSAMFLLSGVISYLLDYYFAFTMSFFSGLILASSFIIFKHIDNHKLINILFGILGIAAAIPIIFLRPVTLTEFSYSYLVLSGFLGISAMFLPGISGAFVLLIMGTYEHMLNSIHSIRENLADIGVFILGLIIGAFTISRIIDFLFKKDKCKTLYFLLGLVVGSLAIPLKDIQGEMSFDFASITFIILFFIMGVFAVMFVEHLGKRKEEKENLIAKTG